MIVLVTGVPAVGKTSVCSYLATNFSSRYRHCQFGQFILEALCRPDVDEEELRRRPTDYVTAAVIAAATGMLEALVADPPSGIVTLLDSHAVSQDSFGFVSNPDGPSYFRRVRYDAVVQLFASPAVILGRTESARAGRRATTEADVVRHFILQSSVSTLYASLCEAPLYNVAADESVEQVAAIVHELLELLDVRKA